MEVIFVLLPLSLGLALVAVAGFLWANKNRQFDDLDTPSKRVLLEDTPIREKDKSDPPGNIRERP